MSEPTTFPASALHRITGIAPFPQPSIIPTQSPVIFMHGFGVGASFRRAGPLHAEAMYLRSRGVRSYAPNVAPYNTVRVRCEMWEDRLAAVLAECNAERCSIIAHSMGGLDARYLITEKGWHDTVDVLVTVATPHRGSSVACLILEQPDAVQNWLVDMADWLGTHILEDGTANLRKALNELTPEYVEGTFNEEVPNHPDVDYWSYGCQAGQGTDTPIAPVFRFLNKYLFDREGANDGIVSVRSARWGQYQDTIDADHARQVGIRSTLAANFDSNEFYASIAEKLAERDE